MAYTNAWSDVIPAGTDAANTADDQIRQLRIDVHERMDSLVADWTTDPIVLQRVETCRVYHSATQLSDVEPGKVLAFDSEVDDPDAMHDPVTNNSRITIVTAGRYIFGAFVTVLQDATGPSRSQLRIRLNGVTIISKMETHIPASNFANLSLVDIRSFALNDYIQALLWDNSPAQGQSTAQSGSEYTYFFCARLTS